MKRSIKAALLSALVLPGAGHLYLKIYFTAALLSATALTALYFLISSAVEKALQITDKILSGEVPPEMSVIADLISKQSMGDDAQLIQYATAALIVTWVIGIVDAYRAGRVHQNTVNAGG